MNLGGNWMSGHGEWCPSQILTLPGPFLEPRLLQPRDYLASADLVIKKIFLAFIVLGRSIKVQ